ncbi:MAG: hypothetical protein IH820_13060 [Bacteroidetes bacterium]|nr:hypothetical protein [Bacteroidota bacterium]
MLKNPLPFPLSPFPYVFRALVHKALAGLDRAAPFDLLSFPPDSADRFIDARSHIALTHDDITWVRLG